LLITVVLADGYVMVFRVCRTDVFLWVWPDECSCSYDVSVL